MPYRVLQYPIKAEPIPLGAQERSTPDKWESEPQPVPRKTLRLSTALIPSLAFVPLLAAPAPSAVYVSGQSCEPIAVQQFQYQSQTEPPNVSAPVETVTLDKWNQPADLPQRQKLARQSDGAFVVVVVEPETITADKWLTAWSQPLIGPKRLVQYEANFALAEQADDGLPPVHWIPQTNIPIRRGLRSIEQFSFLQISTFGESIYPDKWHPLSQQPRLDLQRVQRLYPSFVSDTLHLVPGAEVVYLDKWNRQYPDLIFRAKRLPDYSYSVRDLISRLETVGLDKWFQPLSEPQRRVRHVQVEIEFIGTPAEVVTVDKWFELPVDLQRRARALQVDNLFLAPSAVPVEIVTLDKWLQESSQPQFIKRRLIEHGVFLFTPEPPLAVSGLDWLIQQTEPMRIKRIITTESYLIIAAILPVSIKYPTASTFGNMTTGTTIILLELESTIDSMETESTLE